MSQAGKLFDKKNGGGGGSEAGKAQGTLSAEDMLKCRLITPTSSDAVCRGDRDAALLRIFIYRKDQPSTRGNANPDWYCDV